jgi:hypothetical protein
MGSSANLFASTVGRESMTGRASMAQSVRDLGIVGEGEEKEEEDDDFNTAKAAHADRDRVLRAAVVSGGITEQERVILMEHPELPLPPGC